jgi:pimeloyl-ACP methyl ester carboxylesterase
LVFAHGNNELIDYWLTGLNGFRDRGFHLLLIEYPGYGRSQGEPSQSRITEQAVAAYDWAIGNAQVDKNRVFGFGMSLGGGVIGALAAQRPFQGLILQSTFPSLLVFANRYAAPSVLLHDQFDTAQTIGRFNGKLLIIHGDQDTVIPLQYARLLASANPRAQFKVYPCGHLCWQPEQLPFWRDFDAVILND